jgi:hypothetical protein
VGRRHRLLAVLTAAFAVCALAAGCAGADEVDAGSLEKAVPAAVLPAHPDLVTDVSCAGPIDRGVGTVTACTANVGGGAVGLTATQTDDDGNVTVAVDHTLLDVDDLAARIGERLTADVGVPTSVLCDGPAVRVLAVDDEIRCVATDTDDRAHTFVATILDEDASYDLRLQ